ncbi:MYO10, partial [Symbiodinium sp. CCMP2456]
ASSLGELPKVHDAQLAGVGNICELVVVDNAAVLHSVRTRYKRSDIYTFVSKMLIAVNPFKELPIYSKENLLRYLPGASDAMDLPPHVYGLGLHAVKGQKKGKSQVVLISGESGAGKTESAKLIMSYISEALGSSRHMQRRDSRPRYSIAPEPGADAMKRRQSRYSVIDPKMPSIQDKIIQTNPILEAFGNAMTVRNNNSSRFGKWTQMMISPNMSIQGCSVTDYLLEVTRVCSRGEKERNYHIFFQLLQARDEEDLKALDIQPPEAYSYLRGSQFHAPHIDDARCFAEVKEAFLALEFAWEVQLEIFKVVMGVLALGNIEFTQTAEEAEVKGGVPEEAAASKSVPPLNQATAVRDTFARLLYGRTFKWLIEKINAKLAQSGTTPVFFGVLDIAGFESFEHNSLEQLFINLSNELLQKHFNEFFFRMELEEYEAEGVSVGVEVQYQDNSDIVEMINGKKGILTMLDDEVLIPKATDQTFVQKVAKDHGNNPRMVKSKMGGAVKFGIKHFAGEVTYDVSGFLDKNMAKLPDEAVELLQSSSCGLIKEIGARVAAESQEAEGSSRGRKAKPKTVSSGFRQSLADLMQTVSSAEPHFIRCLKPNAEKVPDNFDSKFTYEQMLYSGIFEAVRIRQSGFPMRLPHGEVLERYRLLLPRSEWPRFIGRRQVADEEKIQIMVGALRQHLSGLDLPDKGLALGNTKVFGQALTMKTLEEARHKAVQSASQDREKAQEELLRALGSRDIDFLMSAIVQGEMLRLDEKLMKQAEDALEHEENRLEVVAELSEAISVCEVPRLRAIIAKAEGFGLDHADDLSLLQDAISTMQKELWPQARAGLEQAVDKRDITLLREALAEAETVGRTLR